MNGTLDREALQDMLAASPFQAPFDYRIEELDAVAGTIAIRQNFTPAVERLAGTRQFHGGAIAALIDIAGDYALIARLGFAVPTMNFHVDYLRPAIDTALVASATVRRAGRSVGVVDIDVVDDAGRLVAIGRGCYATRAA